MSHTEYLSPRLKITELMCILNVVRYDTFVVTFPIYSIQFPPTVSRNQIDSYLCGCTSNKLCEYVTVNPPIILLRAKKRIVFVPFFIFLGDLSASRPNSFDNPFCQRSLVYFYFCCIRYFHCSIFPVSG